MSLPTVPTSGASKQDPDKQLTENAEVREIYRHEINRLRSFSGWQSHGSAAPTLLAKAGFFYTAHDDTVECFICRVKINKWKMSDDPMKEHKIHSPGCIFIHDGDSGNVALRVGDQKETPEFLRKAQKSEPKEQPMEAERSQNEATALLDKQIKATLENMSEKYPHSIESEKMQGKLKLLQKLQGLPSPEPSPEEELNLSIGQTGSLFRSLFQSHDPPRITQNTEVIIPEEGHQSENLYGTTIFSSPNISEAYVYGDQVRALTIAQIQTELRSGPAFSGATERCALADLIALVDRASSPEYALIKKRYDSFSGWRYTQNADQKKLAEAGFFYTGSDDRVRCFHCNGGLCNWQREDIPWYEHYRWFGKCPYLLKAAKNEVVKVTISTAKHIHGARAAEQSKHHHHHHGSGRTQCDPVQDIWQTDNMKRLISMGFTRNKIQSVIDKKGAQLVNDIEKLIDILDKPAPPAPVLVPRSPPILHSSPRRSRPLDQSSPSKPRIANYEPHRDEQLISAHICQVCRSRKVSLMFLPCRHLVACLTCGIDLNTCPFCNKKVQATSKVEVK